MDRNAPIGIIDTGIGGLTVVRELQRLLPGEDIVYLGDSANCPYGNRPSWEILELGRGMLHFLQGRRVKLAAVACNTLSTLAEALFGAVDLPVVGIIAPAAEAILRDGIQRAGLLATEFTISSMGYDRLIRALDPSIALIGKASPLLAGLIDAGGFDRDRIDAEIRLQVDDILARAPVRHIILGCTHYSVVMDSFRRLYPGIVFIDPAIEQARAIGRRLAAEDGLAPGAKGSLSILTTGDPGVYADVAARLGLLGPASIERVAL
jgi:glutamate racemase